MPFIQRLVKPVNVSQPLLKTSKTDYLLNNNNKIECNYGKCQNNDDVSQHQPPLQTPTHTPTTTPTPTHTHFNQQQLHTQQQQLFERKTVNFDDRDRVINAVELCGSELTPTNSLQIVNVKDDIQTSTQTSLFADISLTTQHSMQKAIFNTTTDDIQPTLAANTPTNTPTLSNRISHDFATDFQHTTNCQANDLRQSILPISPITITPMKKLKQHVEFSSTVPSSLRKKVPNLPLATNTVQTKISNSNTSAETSYGCRRFTSISSSSSPSSANFNKIIAGYEFDSISNITLTNALRQLASLVQIASDMFDDLQWELHFVGVHARALQKKITVIERCVNAYNPKEVRVPESDLLTFAQLKTHYECDKTFTKELFTADTRPSSLRMLYKEAGNYQMTMTGNPNEMHATQTSGAAVDHAFIVSALDTAVKSPSVVNNILHSPIFGMKQRKMHKRIDTEIEIRMPAVMEVLRKWTSTEALGDVTVTPDCMHHIDSSANDSVYQANSACIQSSLLSQPYADVLDGSYTLNSPNRRAHNMAGEPLVRDVPLNHRLPSPEEQCKIIALRYPAEIVSVDTSGKRFERMSMARRTITTTSCYSHIAGNTNNLNDGIQTLHRRSRSRKGRKGHKRRNTLAGIDHKEIQIAANREETSKPVQIANQIGDTGQRNLDINTSNDFKSLQMNRSKSSDVLKKDVIAMPYDKGKSTLIRLNSLKLWGRNRFKLMQRSNENNATTTPTTTTATVESKINNCSISNDLNIMVKPQSNDDNLEMPTALVAVGNQSGKVVEKSLCTNECMPMQKLLDKRKYKCQFLHGMERKASQCTAQLSADNVKLRDSSSLNRSRRNAGSNADDLLGKDEQPHSSSGNWSASSESGRASIGSEITLQPKSCASSTSLNVSNYHGASNGPSSSMLCRKKFLNTSASSCMTSDGNTTPEIQTACQAIECIYPSGMDDETSSAYSCDTEGYYTSFHMDSGLRTLKEEEATTIVVPYESQISDMNCLSSGHTTITNKSQLMLMAENEYELFGHGSTSTTTSSAGTVCTTLMNSTFFMDKSSSGDNTECGGAMAPKLPERISSLNNNINNNNDMLERSVSNSSINSTNGDGTGTIKRNINIPNEIAIYSSCNETSSTEQIRIQSNRKNSNDAIVTETEYSESSDLEGMEHLERFKSKTALTVKRIPSMCIITPTTSEENVHFNDDNMNVEEQQHTINIEEQINLPNINNNTTGEKYIEEIHCLDDNDNKEYSSQLPSQKISEANHLPFASSSISTALTNCDSVCDTAGEYVYLTPINIGIKQNSDKDIHHQTSQHSPTSNAKIVGSENCSSTIQQIDSPPTFSCTKSPKKTPRKSLATAQNIESRVYDANSLKRYKGSHSTFITGPYIRSENTPKTIDALDSNVDSMSPIAKSFLLNGGIGGSRRNASVRPITTKSMLIRNAWEGNKDSHHNITSCTVDTSIESSNKTSNTWNAEDSKMLHLNGSVHDVAKASKSTVMKATDECETLENQTTYEPNERKFSETTSVSSYGSNEDLKHLSDVDQRSPHNVNNRKDFVTSTPIRRNDNNSSPYLSNKSQSLEYFNNSDSNARDRLNTCADRIGQSKTTLMDFKKLLLSKSSKSSILQKRISAVELLKKTNPKNMDNNNDTNAQYNHHHHQQQQQHESNYKSNVMPQLNNSLKLLNLSGSPKTYTYRKFSRQNQFGSPLKRTNIMSTIIPEVSSEEDHTSNSSLANGDPVNNSNETVSLNEEAMASVPPRALLPSESNQENLPSCLNSSPSTIAEDVCNVKKGTQLQTNLKTSQTQKEDIDIYTSHIVQQGSHSDRFNSEISIVGSSTKFSLPSSALETAL